MARLICPWISIRPRPAPRQLRHLTPHTKIPRGQTVIEQDFGSLIFARIARGRAYYQYRARQRA